MPALSIAHTAGAGKDRPASIVSAWRSRLRRRRELRVLLSQPDYLLKDIGVERHQIMREASKPFWLP
jgi:uncharacterized protein YjiS (DUF1127 family)